MAVVKQAPYKGEGIFTFFGMQHFRTFCLPPELWRRGPLSAPLPGRDLLLEDGRRNLLLLLRVLPAAGRRRDERDRAQRPTELVVQPGNEVEVAGGLLRELIPSREGAGRGGRGGPVTHAKSVVRDVHRLGDGVHVVAAAAGQGLRHFVMG